MTWLLISMPSMVAGLIVVLRGLNPPGGDLSEVLADYEQAQPTETNLQVNVNSALGGRAVALVEFLEQDRFGRLLADLEIVGEDLKAHALERVGLAAVGGPVVVTFAVLSGIASSLWILSVIGLLATMIGYLIPGQQISSKAQLRRTEFDIALRDVLTLLVSSTRGGGGLNTAIQDAMSICTAESMDVVKRDLWDKMLRGEQPADILLNTGLRLKIESLVSLGQSLSIAASSGASIDATLVSRGQVAAEAETMRRLRSAEEEGEKMSIFVGVIAFGLSAFLLYPSIVSIFASGG